MLKSVERDIIMTGYAAMGGISYVLYNKENELRECLPGFIIDNAKNYVKEPDYNTYEDYVRLSDIIKESDFPAKVDIVSEGGIIKALWNTADQLKTGITVYQKMIPIKQEFIEICEYYNINPYMLDGKGAFLIVSEHGNVLLRLLEQYGINCAIIGHTTDNNDRIIINNNERRYIESRIVDEITRIGGLLK